MNRNLLVLALFFLGCAAVIFSVVYSHKTIAPYEVEVAIASSAVSAEVETTDSNSTPDSETKPLPPASPININSAAAEELITLPGIGEVIAERIIAYRTEHGGFYDVGELREVQGIGDKTLENLLPYIICE